MVAYVLLKALSLTLSRLVVGPRSVSKQQLVYVLPPRVEPCGLALALSHSHLCVAMSQTCGTLPVYTNLLAVNIRVYLCLKTSPAFVPSLILFLSLFPSLSFL